MADLSALLKQAKSTEWETPQTLFDQLNDEFEFTLDPCATAENAKCAKFYTKEQDGLSQSWAGESVFMNPPYGREIAEWCEKACYEVDTFAMVGLLPARTSTAWFHDFIYKHSEIRFIRGRLKFSGMKNSAPFPSMVVIWN